MEVIYLLSVVTLLTSFILRKKSETKIEIIGFICTSIVLLFCYNTLICYILTFFTIPIKLWLLAIINLLFTTVLTIPIIKKKEIQKYKFNKIDLLYICLIIIVLLLIAYINFGFPLDVNYMSSDPSHHYLTSIKFAEEDTLMPNAEIDPVYGDLSARKPISYVNSGLLMKCFSKDIDSLECYNIFACFSIFVFVLIGITLYCALNKYSKSKEHTLWAFIVTLICSLGYPLNSFVFGFEYLTMGLLLICAIIDMIYYYDNKIFSLPYLVLFFGLLNFGLFCSYYMFVPFVYPALWVYFCIRGYQKNKKIFNKEAIILCSITLLIPFFLGYIYHIEPKIYSILIDKISNSVSFGGDYSSHLVNKGLAVDGFIYINLYSNMLLLLPLTIYLFVIDTKENKLDKELFLNLITILTVCFIGVLLIGYCFGKVSIYYICKNYFALWIILAFTNYKGLVLLSKKSKYLSKLFIYAYIFLIIIYTTFAKVKVDGSNKNEDENLLSLVEIYGANKTLLFYKIHEFEQEELEILDYANKNIDFNSRIEVIADHRSYYWAYVLLRYTDKDELFNTKQYVRSIIIREEIY